MAVPKGRFCHLSVWRVIGCRKSSPVACFIFKDSIDQEVEIHWSGLNHLRKFGNKRIASTRNATLQRNFRRHPQKSGWGSWVWKRLQTDFQSDRTPQDNHQSHTAEMEKVRDGRDLTQEWPAFQNLSQSKAGNNPWGHEEPLHDFKGPSGHARLLEHLCPPVHHQEDTGNTWKANSEFLWR